MEKVSEKMEIDTVSLVKVLDFLPYPFLVSELRNGVRHNIFVNKKFIDEIGYTCVDIPTIGDWFMLAYPDPDYRNEVLNDWNQRIEAAKAQGKDSVVRQAQILTRNNGLKWYEVKASVSGFVDFVAFVNIDEEIIKEQNLRFLNENKNRTLSILSHDLRGPLNNLYSVLQLANNNHLTEQEKQNMLSSLSGQVFRINEFLDTTLHWSKVNFSQLQVNRQVIDAKVIVNTVMDIYRPACLEKQISVITNIDSTFPLYSDPEIVSIIFRNIFSNAIKYSPKEGAVTISNSIENKKYVLSIANSGSISEEKIKAILAKNYTSEPGTKGEKGLGLGLKLCQQLLENIEGSLEIERDKSNRSVFRIIL